MLSNVDSKEKRPLDNKLIQSKLIIIFDVKLRFKAVKREFAADK